MLQSCWLLTQYLCHYCIRISCRWTIIVGHRVCSWVTLTSQYVNTSPSQEHEDYVGRVLLDNACELDIGPGLDLRKVQYE